MTSLLGVGWFKRGRKLLLLAVLSASCSRQQQQSSTAMIQIKGSDTMVHLVSLWAERFMKQHPQNQISVTGGGSGTGIAALMNGTADLCMSSRALEEREKLTAQAKKIQPQETIVGRDGLAVVVHASNPVSELTLNQLKLMYTGKVSSWKEVGGGPEPILLLSRESNSGTYVYFQEHVLQKDDFSPRARLISASSTMIQSVKTDVTSIAYSGLGYVHVPGVKMIRIKADEKSVGVEPTVATVKDGTYPISRPLFFYSQGAPSENVKQFLDFVLGPEGQQIVLEAGYVPL